MAEAEETARRSEFNILLAWQQEYGSMEDDRWPDASDLTIGGYAIVGTAVPLRDDIPRPNYGGSTPYDEDLTTGNPPFELNDERYHSLGVLPAGTRVRVVALLHSGAAEVEIKNAPYGRGRGQIVAQALRPISDIAAHN